MASQQENSAMNEERMPLEESFHNFFFYFMKAVDVLSLDSAEQCEVMGNFNVAWEIQHDVLDGGTALINWPEDYLLPAEKAAITELLPMLRDLPDGALQRTHEHKQAMSHPAWADLRIAAKRLRVQLEDAVKRNHEFFGNQRAQS
jgi:hypothetical protein